MDGFQLAGEHFDATWKMYQNNVSQYFKGGKSGAHPLAHPDGGWGYSYAGIYEKNGKTYLAVVMDSHDGAQPLEAQKQFMEKLEPQKSTINTEDLTKGINIGKYNLKVNDAKKLVTDTTGIKYLNCKINLKRKVFSPKDINKNIGILELYSGSHMIFKSDVTLVK